MIIINLEAHNKKIEIYDDDDGDAVAVDICQLLDYLGDHALEIAEIICQRNG